MKKVIMMREKLFKTQEFEVSPEDPDIVLNDNARFENEDDRGYWNEYYRVGEVDDEADLETQNAQFQETAGDFYNRLDAQSYYRELVAENEKTLKERSI